MNLPRHAAGKPSINLNPGQEFSKKFRQWQGIPGIERSVCGRLWATWYSGGETEPKPENYVLLATSDDDGKSWTEPVAVISPEGDVRAFDPVLWFDPLGRLWWFWSQNHGEGDGIYGVWGAFLENPDSDNKNWSEPSRLCNGIMMNKPIVTTDGIWLLPTAIWQCALPFVDEVADERFSNVVASYDNGKTFNLIGHADVPHRSCDEHYIVERKNGSLWMLVRTCYGIGQSFSNDGGVTWSRPGVPSEIPTNVSSRFFICRLRSGKLLLIYHAVTDKLRKKLTAALSDDDGLTWYGNLLLDEREQVSYPDAIEADDGRIFVIYDYNRYSDKEILMAIVTEEDIVMGECISKYATLKMAVSKLQ